MYRNIKSLYCTPGIGQLCFKQTHKRDQICGDQRMGVGEEELDESGKRYKLPVIRQSLLEYYVQCDNIINTAVSSILKLLRE